MPFSSTTFRTSTTRREHVLNCLPLGYLVMEYDGIHFERCISLYRLGPVNDWIINLLDLFWKETDFHLSTCRFRTEESEKKIGPQLEATGSMAKR